MINRKAILVILGALLVVGCAPKLQSKDYSTFHAAAPRSVVVVPVINHSPEADAADFFLTTVAVPLAEHGYYVFPTNMIKSLMEREGLSDPQLVHSTATPDVARLFNADAVVYIEIKTWNAKYAVLAAGIEVEFLYTIKSGRTGELLWQEQKKFYADTSANSGNILADLIANAVIAAVNETRSDFTPQALAANMNALLTPGSGIPYGPYAAKYNKDSAEFPSTGTGKISNATDVAVAYPQGAPQVGEENAQEAESAETAKAAGSAEAAVPAKPADPTPAAEK
jgi:hypothetical protein